jgi:RNA-directed DNA polymerase
VIQGVVKTAIEPGTEAVFTHDSYGFRPAYTTHDAIQAIYHSINHQIKWVLDADIKGCFDNIDHDFLLMKFSGTHHRLIKQWLTAKIIDKNLVKACERGTPQGGVISPLLANMALDGMENDLKAEIRKLYNAAIAKSLKVVRYADDFVVLHKDFEVVKQCQELLIPWLKTRGLEFSPDKTGIKTTLEGFDFVGFNVRHYAKPLTGRYADVEPGKQWFKTLIKPSKNAIKEHVRELSQVVRSMNGQSQEKLIDALNPKIRGWANYHRHVVSSKVFSAVDNWMGHRVWRWSVRRHPRKGKRWVFKKYFRTIKTRTGQFASKTKQLARHAATKIRRFVKIRAGKSVYDGDEIYWASRLARGYGDITSGKAARLKKQEGRCAGCLMKFRNGDLMETHHIKPRKQGGRDKEDNLVLLHKHCHDQYHALELKRRHDQRRSNDDLAPVYREMSDLQAEIMGIV